MASEQRSQQSGRAEIVDEGSLHKYRTEIPNTVIRGMKSRGLSVHAKWLYVYLKSITGEKGTCYQSTTTMAAETGMSRGQISAAKKELALRHLIVVTSGPTPKRDADHIRIKDIWLANFQEFSVHMVNTEEEVKSKYSEIDATSSVHHMNTENDQSSYGELTVHTVNTGHQEPVKSIDQSSYGELTVHTVNTGHQEPVKSIDQSSYGELTVHTVNQRRSLEEEEKDKDKEPPSVSPSGETSPRPRLTPDGLVELYNTLTPDACPRVKTLSPARRAKAKAYLAMFPRQDFWHTVFTAIRESPFLLGAVPRPGHQRFRADFDWLLSKGKDGTENCVKVAEGKYRDAPGTSPGQAPQTDEEKLAALYAWARAEDAREREEATQ